jgi:transposase
MVRKQKTDSRDALHILDLLLTNRFPRIWVPSPEERDLRQMLRHRHKLVRFRTSVMNQLHALAIGQGLCRRKKLWAQIGRMELQGLILIQGDLSAGNFGKVTSQTLPRWWQIGGKLTF